MTILNFIDIYNNIRVLWTHLLVSDRTDENYVEASIPKLGVASPVLISATSKHYSPHSRKYLTRSLAVGVECLGC